MASMTITRTRCVYCHRFMRTHYVWTMVARYLNDPVGEAVQTSEVSPEGVCDPCGRERSE